MTEAEQIEFGFHHGLLATVGEVVCHIDKSPHHFLHTSFGCIEFFLWRLADLYNSTQPSVY